MTKNEANKNLKEIYYFSYYSLTLNYRKLILFLLSTAHDNNTVKI